MKFIISENKLEGLKERLDSYIKKYLDSYIVNKDSIEMFGNFILINAPERDEWDEPMFEYDFEDGRLYVKNSVRDVFSGMFGLNKKESDLHFKKWFENKFDVEVKFLE